MRENKEICIYNEDEYIYKYSDTLKYNTVEKSYPNTLKDYCGDILLVGINYDEKTKQPTCIIEDSINNT